MRALTRLSFTTRLMLVAFVAAVGPIAVAYVAMLDLPRTVAGDSLELALRDSASTVLGNIREQRLALREEMAVLRDDPVFQRAVLNRDRTRLQTYLVGRSGGDLRIAYPAAGATTAPETGPVNAPIPVASGSRSNSIVVYRPIDQESIKGLVSDTSTPVAVTRGTAVMAATADFPHLSQTQVRDVEQSSRSTSLAEGGVHVFARPVGLDARNYVLVASTKALEQRTLAAPRRDIARTLALLALATAAFAAFGGVIVNRSIRRFSTQAKVLAAGDYDARLPVHGSDAFGELAGSFNQLAEEVQQRIGEIELTASTYARTLESIDDGVCVWRNDRVVLWSPSAERMTGVTEHELQEEHPLAAMLRGELVPGTRRVRLPSSRGARVAVELTVTPVEGVGALQTFRDLTMVEALNQTRRNFMATAAHELRTPLTSILGFSSTLDDGVALTDDQRTTFVKLIREQAEQLQRLIDAFFTNAQLANERVEIALEPVPLDAAVRGGVDKARQAMQTPGSTDVAIEVDLRLVVEADRRALEGVVAILLDNAWKYGREGVRIEASVDGDDVHLQVHDRGEGIEPQHLDRIFDPFYRVDVDMRGGVGGAGLGLFTARKLVNGMRGAISVESHPGEGTTFTVELHRAPPGAHEGATAVARDQGVDGRKPGTRV